MDRRSWAVCVALIVASSCSSSPQTSGESASSSNGTPRPTNSTEAAPSPRDDGLDFSVQTFSGERFRLADHRGMPVVLNFWESW